MRLTIATWNINSVRLREGLVAKLLSETAPDVLCLQETKSPVELIPTEGFADLGYRHMVARGQKGYNGVAILSRLELEDAGQIDFCEMGDARHVSARVDTGSGAPIVVHNLYVPAGGDEPDRTINDKFGHKLDFVDEMRDWFPANRKANDKVMVVGDLNIAPLEHDVWSHKQLLKVVSHTPIEVEKFNAAQEAFGWVDCMRKFVPDEEKLYTWWSYRAKDWRGADKGRRLDHVWATPSVAGTVRSMDVVKDARGWEKPSDHAPVIVDLAD